MSSYDPENSSIEKFMISRLFYIFVMLRYLSPFTSYNPFYDKIQLINQLPGDFSNVNNCEGNLKKGPLVNLCILMYK